MVINENGHKLKRSSFIVQFNNLIKQVYLYNTHKYEQGALT